MKPARTLRSLPELLTTIPEVLGYTPAESLVLLPICGRQSAALIRVDLPHRSTRTEAHEYCAAVVDHLLRLADVTAFYAVAYTDADLDPDFPPHGGLIAEIAEFAAAVGIRLGGAVCVTPQGWQEYWGEASGTLTEIESDLAAVIADDIAELTEIVPAPAEARSRVAELLTHQSDAEPTDDEVLCAWNLYVDGANWLDPVYEPILIAVVASGIARPRTLEQLVASGAFGNDTAELVQNAWLDFADYMAESELVGITELFAEEIPADLERAERATTALRSLISHLDAPLAQHGYAALAWMHACCGRASLATEYARQALRCGHHDLAARVLERIDDGYVPGWIHGASCLGPVRDAELVGTGEDELEW